MKATLDKLLHMLANRMQAASAGAALLDLSGTAREDSTAEALQKLIDELQAATKVVQAMASEYESAQAKRKSAAS